MSRRDVFGFSFLPMRRQMKPALIQRYVRLRTDFGVTPA